MKNPTRRQTLALGLGATGAIFSPRMRGTFLRNRFPDEQTIAELALAFRETPRGKVFGVAAEAMRAGVTREVFLGAVFRAGVEDVRPRPHGVLHCVMEVESNFQLADASPPEEAWLPALWNLDDFKVSQARDVAENGDWKLPARPDVPVTSETEARQEFLAAMRAYDPERADRALVGLLPHHDHASMFELLWPIALRCFAFIGHKVIYVVQIERVLRRIGWDQAEPALRSLVQTVLVEQDTADFERARGLTSDMDADWKKEGRNPADSEALLGELRMASPAEAQGLVMNGLDAGIQPESIWDGVRLLGSELFLRRPGITAAAGREALLPVHGVTIPNAIGHIYRSTRDPETRRLALLQAAAWTAGLRIRLGSMVGLSMTGPGIELLGGEARVPEGLGALLEEPSAAGACVLLDETPGLMTAYAQALRHSLYRRGVEHHQHKYAAAALEDSGRVHPRWRPHLLAAGIEYLATPGEPETEVHQRSMAALREAGVL